jgi:hypothetical protein
MYLLRPLLLASGFWNGGGTVGLLLVIVLEVLLLRRWLKRVRVSERLQHHEHTRNTRRLEYFQERAHAEMGHAGGRRSPVHRRLAE